MLFPSCFALTMFDDLSDTVMTLFCPGQKRIAQLAFNTRYFREKLKAMGLIVYGNRDSPIIPVLLFMPGKVA